jgi:alkyldihydroxyacetonephosphate synthase
LLQLLLGSEGTLAIFTSARLRIWPRPRERWLRGVRFSALPDALRAVREVLRSGLSPSIVRLHDPLDTLLSGTGTARVPQPLRWLVDGAQMEAMRISLRAPVLLNKLVDALPEASLVILEFEGEIEGDAAREGEAALAICARASGEVLEEEVATRSLASAARARWAQAPLVAAGAFVETIDVATTWDRAEPLLRAVRGAVEDLAFVRASLSHAAPEGCAMQFRLVGLAGAPAEPLARATPDEAEEDLVEARRRSEAASAAALEAAADAGATISHHSGIGASRQPLLRRELGEGIRQLRALKRAFDPHGILNPGKALL